MYDIIYLCVDMIESHHRCVMKLCYSNNKIAGTDRHGNACTTWGMT